MHLARSTRGGRPRPPLTLSVARHFFALKFNNAPSENAGFVVNSRTGEKGNQEAPLGGLGGRNPKPSLRIV